MRIKFLPKICLYAWLLPLALTGTVSAQTVEFTACNPVAVKDGATTVRALGMFNISPGGVFTRYTSSNGMNSLCGGFVADGLYYEFKVPNINSPTMLQLQKWNYPAMTRSGGVLSCPKDTMFTPDVAYNPVDKMVYGCFQNAAKTGWVFGCFNPATFSSNSERSTIATLPKKLLAMAFAPSGVLYAIDEAGDLYSIAAADGAMTLIGATGYVPTKAGSATVDSRTGILYAVIPTATGSYLVRLSTSTGKATVLQTFPYGEQWRGLTVYRPSLPDDVPSYPERVTFSFDKASLTGTLSFRMPAELYGGSLPFGNANYTVTIGSTQVASGSAAYGAEVSNVAVTAPAAGVQNAQVVISNSTGNGPAYLSEIKVGPGTPKTPANVSANYQSGQFTVSWDAVTESADGCWFDPANVTYTVTRLPDNVVVADKTTRTSITDRVTPPLEPTSFSYSVVANHEGKSSAAAVSPGVTLGAIQPPYSNDFETGEQCSEFTIINVNNDAAKWTWSNGALAMPASNTQAMNDWVVTPPLALKAGHAYVFNADVQGMYINVKEKFEVKIGKTPSVAGLNISLVAPKEVVLESKPTQAIITVSEDGMYYLGFHAMSAAGSGAIFIHEMNIGEPLLTTAPQAPSALRAVPAADDSNDVTLSFTAPTKTMTGSALASLTKIEVYRGETLVNTFDTPAVGASLSYLDKVPQAGDVTYKIVPFNADGKGESTSIKVYAGVNYPGAVRSLKVVESPTEGEVVISWNSPGVDAAGFSINDNLVAYDVYSAINGQRELLASDLTQLSFTHVACQPGDEQKFMQYGVIAKTVRGESDGAATELLPVGTSYSLPFSESFSFGSLNHIMGSEVLSGLPANVQWIQCTNGDINKYEAADGDNGFIAHYAKYTDQGGRIFTGKIRLDAQKPLLWFSTYCINSGHTGLIRVFVKNNNTWTEVKALRVNEIAEDNTGWARAVVDLSAFAGKTIQLGLAATTSGYAHTLFDDIRIFDAKNCDLALVNLNAPLTPEAGKTYSVSFDVENSGADDVAAHEVKLTFNGQDVASATGAALKPGKKQTHQLSFTIPVNAARTNSLQASVVLPADESNDNNTHSPLTINIAAGQLPGVKNLQAQRSENEIVLSWEAAEPYGSPVALCSFDDMASWQSSDDDWTFIDADNAEITGISGLNLPNITPKSKQSWWVMDNTLEAIAEEYDFRPKSGSKFLAAMALYNGGKTDDWAISPQLPGCSQSIGFFARSFHGRFPESFEVLYSLSGKAIGDFVSLASVENVPYAWTEYSYVLPEGARYVAVRHNTTGGFMLYMDDFTFTPLSSQGEPLQLEGYHVFADGQQLTEQPIQTNSFTFSTLPTRAVSNLPESFSVYPVYAQGIGAGMDADLPVGVADISTESLKVTAYRGRITIEGCAGEELSVFSASGVNYFTGRPADRLTVEAPAGIYLLKTSRKVIKVRVR